MAGSCLTFGYEIIQHRYKTLNKSDVQYDVTDMLQNKYMGKDYTEKNEFLAKLDAAIRVNPEEQRGSQIARHVEKFVEQLLEKTKVIEPNLQLKVS